MNRVAVLTILLSILCVAFADVTINVAVSQYNQTSRTCVTVQQENCFSCGNQYYYFYQSGTYLYGYIYSNSICSNFAGYANFYESTCNVNNAIECAFYYHVTSISGYSLTLSSTAPISANYLGEEFIISQISEAKISAEGNLLGLAVHSDSKNFRFERQLSTTQYSSTLGVFNFGQTYTIAPFTFTANTATIPYPPSGLSNYFVNIEWFVGVQVTNDEEYTVIYYGEEGELAVNTDSSHDLSGLYLTNPYYNAANMTLFPPFGSYYDANLVYQLHVHHNSLSFDTDYYTVACYVSESGPYTIYDCDIGSLSLSYLSFSFDEIEHQSARNPDDMAFALF